MIQCVNDLKFTSVPFPILPFLRVRRFGSTIWPDNLQLPSSFSWVKISVLIQPHHSAIISNKRCNLHRFLRCKCTNCAELVYGLCLWTCQVYAALPVSAQYSWQDSWHCYSDSIWRLLGWEFTLVQINLEHCWRALMLACLYLCWLEIFL